MRKPKLIGVLNITPDSCSDGGLYITKPAILACAKKLCEDGADIIDIGAESTRPGANKLSDEEEWGRLADVLEDVCSIAHTYNRKVSIDTYHYATAKRAIECGVDYINDQTAGRDPKMVELIACNANVGYIIMHHLNIPEDRTISMPESSDVVEEVIDWLSNKLKILEKHGVSKERVVIDPGIGFGKTAEQSMVILKNIKKFKRLKVPILVGHSRKSFITKVIDKSYQDRDIETYGLSVYLMLQGVDYLRLHDVDGNRRIIDMYFYLTTI